MSKTIGRFYFKLTDSKNLIGEFSNNTSKRNYTESADRIIQVADEGTYVGDYYTTWHEEKGQTHHSVLAKLKIDQKSGCQNIFTLTWIVNGATAGHITTGVLNARMQKLSCGVVLKKI